MHPEGFRPFFSKLSPAGKNVTMRLFVHFFHYECNEMDGKQYNDLILLHLPILEGFWSPKSSNK